MISTYCQHFASRCEAFAHEFKATLKARLEVVKQEIRLINLPYNNSQAINRLSGFLSFLSSSRDHSQLSAHARIAAV